MGVATLPLSFPPSGTFYFINRPYVPNILVPSVPTSLCTKGPFIYYVIIFLGFLDPPPPLRNHDFSTENNQKLAFSDPSPPLQVIT